MAKTPAAVGADPASPWTRPRFLLAATAVALIALLAVVVTLTRPDPRAEPPTAPPPAAASPPAPAGDASICGLPPGDQAVPVVPPEVTDWELVGTMAAPTGPQVGPGLVQEGLRTCYARSPLGALYAATGFLAAASDPGLRLRAAQALAAAGEGQDRAVDLLEGADPGGADSGLQVAGFTFLNYDPAAAVVDVAMSVESTPVHLPVSMRWEGGDWKVLLPPSGQPFEGIAPLPNLTGYVPWSGA
jgi:hypothetical protein